jgi:ElaB/YqjD/DUF883 family membrane-anchored ribosome-binding protein
MTVRVAVASNDGEDKMSESMDDVQREIARTRERMSSTVAEIDARVSDRVEGAKDRLNIVQLVRDHPWPALAIALGTGVLLSATGADTRAARATKRAVLAAPGAVKHTAEHAVDSVRERFAGDGSSDGVVSESSARLRGLLGSFAGRLTSIIAAPLVSRIDILVDEMRTASHDLGASLAASSRGSASRAAFQETHAPPVARAESPSDTYGAPSIESLAALSPADAVPVPTEMMPVELDARANAVEAQGGTEAAR